MNFTDLQIIEPILEALQAEGYTHPTPIQQQAIPILLNRKDFAGLCSNRVPVKPAAFCRYLIPATTYFQSNPAPLKG